jgi:hypothetical protein
MKTLKKSILTILILFFFAISSTFAQSGWSSGNYYAYKGRSVIQTTYQNEWNSYYGRYVNVKYCQKLNWYQEYHSGYVNYWRYNSYYGRYQWVTEWKEGSFWYCTWSNWYTC